MSMFDSDVFYVVEIIKCCRSCMLDTNSNAIIECRHEHSFMSTPLWALLYLTLCNIYMCNCALADFFLYINSCTTPLPPLDLNLVLFVVHSFLDMVQLYNSPPLMYLNLVRLLHSHSSTILQPPLLLCTWTMHFNCTIIHVKFYNHPPLNLVPSFL